MMKPTLKEELHSAVDLTPLKDYVRSLEDDNEKIEMSQVISNVAFLTKCAKTELQTFVLDRFDNAVNASPESGKRDKEKEKAKVRIRMRMRKRIGQG